MKTFTHHSLIKYVLDRKASVMVFNEDIKPLWSIPQCDLVTIIEAVESMEQSQVVVYPSIGMCEWVLLTPNERTDEIVSDYTCGGVVEEWVEHTKLQYS